MMKSGSGVMIAVPRVAGPPVTWVFSLYVVQAGSACRGVAGRPAPTAFNRAGEKLQATGEELQGVVRGGPRHRDGLALPLVREEGLQGADAGSRRYRWSGSLRRAGGVLAGGLAGGDGSIPAGAVDDHGVHPAQQRGGAGDTGLGAPRPCCGGRRAGLPVPAAACSAGSPAAWVIAWYLAAITGLNWSIGHTMRQTASRRPGRPRREMCASPRKAPDSLSRGTARRA